MAGKDVRITFVVQGREVAIDADSSGTTRDAIRLALEKFGADGDSGEWTARTTEGRALDNGKSLIEGGIDSPTKLYIGPKPSSGTGSGGTDKIVEMAGGAERRSVEFKESTAWKDMRCVLTRTIMAMANLKGGGKIIIGVKEGPGKTPDPVGMTRADFDSYNQDDIASFVNEYAEPSVAVMPRKITSGGKHYVILDVSEYDEVPIVCKKDGRKACAGHLRRGSIYHRPKRKVESTDRFDYSDMRELVDRAATKQHALMHRQCTELYGMGGGGEKLPTLRTPGARVGSRSAKHGGEGEEC